MRKRVVSACHAVSEQLTDKAPPQVHFLLHNHDTTATLRATASDKLRPPPSQLIPAPTTYTPAPRVSSTAGTPPSGHSSLTAHSCGSGRYQRAPSVSARHNGPIQSRDTKGHRNTLRSQHFPDTQRASSAPPRQRVPGPKSPNSPVCIGPLQPRPPTEKKADTLNRGGYTGVGDIDVCLGIIKVSAVCGGVDSGRGQGTHTRGRGSTGVPARRTREAQDRRDARARRPNKWRVPPLAARDRDIFGKRKRRENAVPAVFNREFVDYKREIRKSEMRDLHLFPVGISEARYDVRVKPWH
ncbi:hypothetical protein SKAU_G00408290 [Synaphobranchus kaupii]|uniref:Uncharacterized protein n=1 Tax=Synaphobranchus kaupii TaxID=118154 RepID=A0A9Q1IC88_SYNKA|nr:hypothetical protein SKAU_G00408290 [Synaphobranchus kaupii]